jgi:hypothetical protein
MLLKYAILKNEYVFIHAVLAALLFFVLRLVGLNDQITFSAVIGVAVAYEVIMFYYGEWKVYAPFEEKKDTIDSVKAFEYWQKKRYKLDALGDILAAVFSSLLIVL